MIEAIHDYPDPQGEDPAATLEVFKQLLEQRDRLAEHVMRLEVALRAAIRNTTRVRRRTIEVDPAGNVSDADWTDKTREWAQLCSLNLDEMDPCHYLGALRDAEEASLQVAMDHQKGGHDSRHGR